MSNETTLDKLSNIESLISVMQRDLSALQTDHNRMLGEWASVSRRLSDLAPGIADVAKIRASQIAMEDTLADHTELLNKVHGLLAGTEDDDA